VCSGSPPASRRQALGRDDARAAPSLPARDDHDDQQKREGIAGEHRSNTNECDQEARDRGADGTGDIYAGAVEGDRGPQLLAGHELRHDRLPARARGGSEAADHECEEKEQRGSHRPEGREDCKDREDRGCCDLRHEEQTPTIDDVGEGACRQDEQDERQRGERLDEANERCRSG
jgi:hypothetical protein